MRLSRWATSPYETGADLEAEAALLSRRVRVMEAGFLHSATPVTWLNRLSDYLWILARREEGDHTTPRRSV